MRQSQDRCVPVDAEHVLVLLHLAKRHGLSPNLVARRVRVGRRLKNTLLDALLHVFNALLLLHETTHSAHTDVQSRDDTKRRKDAEVPPHVVEVGPAEHTAVTQLLEGDLRWRRGKRLKQLRLLIRQWNVLRRARAGTAECIDGDRRWRVVEGARGVRRRVLVLKLTVTCQENHLKVRVLCGCAEVLDAVVDLLDHRPDVHVLVAVKHGAAGAARVLQRTVLDPHAKGGAQWALVRPVGRLGIRLLHVGVVAGVQLCVGLEVLRKAGSPLVAHPQDVRILLARADLVHNVPPRHVFDLGKVVGAPLALPPLQAVFARTAQTLCRRRSMRPSEKQEANTKCCAAHAAPDTRHLE
eukprot:Rhum_TRINITY_DN20800_c0_g1::Rhum_TRINITY_DN20800_c0_g1_i1::g.172216::m.172216